MFGSSDSLAASSNGTGGFSVIKNEQTSSGKGAQYAGILKKSEGFFFGFFGLLRPKAPYELIGTNGKRILYVETSDILLNGDLLRFINKRVVVCGEVQNKGNDTILKANYIYFD
ncbi:MAG: hypothetical protein LBI37_00845 [Puniceicoccales bacterium]|nr:hypothetical protein [Puniceicoccales bacterium]